MLDLFNGFRQLQIFIQVLRAILRSLRSAGAGVAIPPLQHAFRSASMAIRNAMPEFHSRVVAGQNA